MINEKIKMKIIQENENTEQGRKNMFEMIDDHECWIEILILNNENIDIDENASREYLKSDNQEEINMRDKMWGNILSEFKEISEELVLISEMNASHQEKETHLIVNRNVKNIEIDVPNMNWNNKKRTAEVIHSFEG